MLDIAVIGSGPCALALLARLAAASNDHTVDDSLDFLYGFDSKVESIRRTQQRLNAQSKRCMGGDCHASSPLDGHVKVYDATGEWMGRWNRLFRTLEIPHLRSPHVMHPCPTHTM